MCIYVYIYIYFSLSLCFILIIIIFIIIIISLPFGTVVLIPFFSVIFSFFPGVSSFSSDKLVLVLTGFVDSTMRSF